MFQEFHDEHDQHPDILDHTAIFRPQAKSWNWQLTVLVFLLFAIAAWFLPNAYWELTSDSILINVQIWAAWIASGVGIVALVSAFLLRRRSRMGWLSTTTLVSFLAIMFTILLMQRLFNVYFDLILISELVPDSLMDMCRMAMLPINYFMLYLIGQKSVHQIFGVPIKWFWICLAVGGALGAVVGIWLNS